MRILGIESTCDETAASVVENGVDILSNVVSSQIDLHKQFGGVVPELACRRHIDVIIPVIDQALKEANLDLTQIDGIAVSRGPGLIGALLIGLNTAKALALSHNIPLIGINHIEAHLYAALMNHQNITFPLLGAVLSGGHSSIILIESIGQYHLIGETVDDAIGEAFDKVAKILGLPYPGGPEVEKMAKSCQEKNHSFKSGVVKGAPLNFSFSGLKTSVLYAVKGQNSSIKNSSKASLNLSLEEKQSIASAFQETAVSDVINKLQKACKLHPEAKGIVLGGGVTNNQYLQSRLLNEIEFPCYFPKSALTLDNAAMIAGLGYHKFLHNKQGDQLDIQAKTRISF